MTLKQRQRSNLTLAKDSQAMISSKLFCHSKPIGPMIKEILGPFDMMTDHLTLKICHGHIFILKQGHNYSQASFPSSHVYFMQI